MEDSNDTVGRGRRISRRSRTGFAFSRNNMTDASSGDSVAGEEDEDLNEAVEAMAHRPTASLPPRANTTLAQAPAAVAGSPSEEFNPRDRLGQVRRRASEYEKEYRLGLLHRLMMRRVPIDEIADQLGISVSQVYRDREELKRRLRNDARSLDIEEIIGDSKGYYEEAAAMAMRAASNSNVPMPMRLAAIRTALAAKNDQHRFFQTAGVYDVLRFKLAQDGTGISDVKRLMDNTERLLQGESLEFSNAAHEVIDSGNHEEIEL